MLRRHFLASGAVALLAAGVEGSRAAQAGAPRKVAIASTRIVGRRGSCAADRTALAEGAPVALRRVPEDRFDPRAIVALDEQGRALGRLPGVDCRISRDCSMRAFRSRVGSQGPRRAGRSALMS